MSYIIYRKFGVGMVPGSDKKKGFKMTPIPAMMDLIENKIVSGKSYKMKNFYKMVEENLKLDLEDHDPEAPLETGNPLRPKWRRNVRHALCNLKNKNRINWNPNNHYYK